VAIGLAAVLAARSKTLLIDLNFDNPEIAPLLDVDPEFGVFDLAHNAQLAPVSDADLERRLGRRDGIAVLPGIGREEDVEHISDHFLAGLLQTATRRFDHVVIDLGRLRQGPRASVATGVLLWVATPTPLGMDALERHYWRSRGARRGVASAHQAGHQSEHRRVALWRRAICRARVRAGNCRRHSRCP